jgi:TetR/AcrR family transcriptional repressor of mexJK operon
MRRRNFSNNPDKRSSILNAARVRFSRFGLSKVTMDEIAADLGMSKAALYYYFPTKEDIFRQVIAAEQDDFVCRIELIIQKTCSASEKLGEFFAEHLTLLGTLLDLRILSDQAGQAIKPIMRDLFKKFSRKETVFLETILRDGRKRKEFTIDFPEKTAILLEHVLQGLRIRFIKSIRGRDFGKAEVGVYRNEILYFSKIFLRGISK